MNRRGWNRRKMHATGRRGFQEAIRETVVVPQSGRAASLAVSPQKSVKSVKSLKG